MTALIKMIFRGEKYMTLEEFMQKYNIKRKQKLLEWISKGLIPKANIERNYVPNSARVPYTKSRARKVQVSTRV